MVDDELKSAIFRLTSVIEEYYDGEHREELVGKLAAIRVELHVRTVSGGRQVCSVSPTISPCPECGETTFYYADTRVVACRRLVDECGLCGWHVLRERLPK